MTQWILTFTYQILADFCDTFSLKNLILGKSCFPAVSGTSVDIMLTNRPRRFQITSINETGFTDQCKLIVSFFGINFARLPPKIVEY